MKTQQTISEKISEYLHLAYKIDNNFTEDIATNYEAYLVRVIELAKMLQIEEKFRLLEGEV